MITLSSITNFLSSILSNRIEECLFVVSNKDYVQEDLPFLSEKNCNINKNNLADLTKDTMMSDQLQWSLVVADHSVYHDTNIRMPFQVWHNESQIGSVQYVDVLNNISDVSMINRNNTPKTQVMHFQKSHHGNDGTLVSHATFLNFS